MHDFRRCSYLVVLERHFPLYMTARCLRIEKLSALVSGYSGQLQWMKVAMSMGECKAAKEFLDHYVSLRTAVKDFSYVS